MTHKAIIPDYGKRPTVSDGKKGYTGHKLPSPPPQQPQTPSQPTSGSNPQPTSSDKK
jgi:hypothetical protein